MIISLVLLISSRDLFRDHSPVSLTADGLNDKYSWMAPLGGRSNKSLIVLTILSVLHEFFLHLLIVIYSNY